MDILTDMLNNLITAAPVLLIIFCCLIGLLAAGALTIPIIAYFEKKHWI